MTNRQPTIQEKEFESLPFCLFDPFEHSRCEYHTFPPEKEKCKRCIVDSIINSLACDDNASVMRWLISYKKIMEGQIPK